MVRSAMVLLSIFGVSSAFAQSFSNDFSQSDNRKVVLSENELRNRLEVLGEIFLTDKSGNLMMQADETRLWKFGTKGDLVSNWSYVSGFSKEVAIKHSWTLGPSNRLLVRIQQFESMKRKGNSRDVVTGKLVKEELVVLKDFSPIVWAAHEESNQRVVVRLTPKLGENQELIEADQLPITLKNPIVFDNKGRFWAQGHNLEGRYLAMKTHVGQVAFSFVPFKGARELGYVDGNQIVLSEEDLRVIIGSEAPILPTSKRAKIYGFVNFDNKSETLNSVQSSSSVKEKDFLQRL